ncbi:MAG: hypothetical protein IJ874_09245 [Ruminococcus sp.]|nr:hypothetical protein [Ruminococcus sp.]
MNMWQSAKCKRILEHYGFDNQQEKLVEECEELIEAAQGEDWDHFIEELADVRIMVEQMYYALDPDQQKQYHEMVGFKIERTLQRMRDEKAPTVPGSDQ